MIYGNGGHASVIRDFYKNAAVIVAIGDNRKRKEVVGNISGAAPFGVAIHPTAVVSPSAVIKEGSVIMAGAVIQANAVIGKHCIVNSGASVDHDCVLEDFVHIAPGARLCGNVHVGEGSLVAVGVGIAPKGKIPPWTLVKARALDLEPL